MNYRQRRTLCAAQEALAFALGAPAWLIGFAARFCRDRFHDGHEAAHDWWFALRQQRETYQIDDQLNGRRGG